MQTWTVALFSWRGVARALLALALAGLAQAALAACGGEGERLCNLFVDGRMGCNNGLADVNGKCQRPGTCGAEGQRLCYLLIDGRGGCNADLADNGQAVCTHPNCGRLNERACAIFGRNSCDAGLADINGTCLRAGDCGGEGQRLCYVFADGRGGCNADLADNGQRVCAHPNCGRLNERPCAVFGRNSCDAGLADINGTCLRAGDCGGEGQRLCYVFADGRGGCNADLADNGQGVCTHPACGRLGESACAVVGRNSCDAGLVEFNNRCAQRGACGANGQRACLLGERNGSGCDANLVEMDFMCRVRGQCGAVGQRACLLGERTGGACNAGLTEAAGQCVTCGKLGQHACAIVGRNSCDADLVEVNDMCFARGACGSADERACLIGERQTPGCDAGLVEQQGMCFQCGGPGQRACAILGRNSCDPGLVEVNNICLARADCGRAHQRACLIGERATPGCDSNLVERDGMCFSTAPEPAPVPPKVLVHVHTDPPLPFLLGRGPVSLVASVYDWQSKMAVKANKIELLQSRYTGPGSLAPRLISTCTNATECQAVLARGVFRLLPNAIAYMARVTVGADVVETPVRIADLKFTGAPVRMDVSAEKVSPTRVSQVSQKRTVDIVLYAGTGYVLATPAGAKVFSDRLKEEHRTMLRASPSLDQPSSLAESLAGVSFYVSLAPATVKHIGVFSMCEHSTSNPVPWGDAQGILHPDLGCRDWSVPGPFYSAGTPAISWHEMHHAAFGLSDEYCAGTIHHQHPRYPNVYGSQQACMDLSTAPGNCMRITEPPGCTGSACSCSTSFWRSDTGTGDAMWFNGVEGPDDWRSARGKFSECKAGGC